LHHFLLDEDKKETVLLVFAEHAREIITTEISLWLTKVLVGEVEDFETVRDGHACLDFRVACLQLSGDRTESGGANGVLTGSSAVAGDGGYARRERREGSWTRGRRYSAVGQPFVTAHCFQGELLRRSPSISCILYLDSDSATHSLTLPYFAVTWQLFPVVNLEGRKRVENGEFCLRKKVNGVDLNRNYPVAFQKEVRQLSPLLSAFDESPIASAA
jgi:hypothetical protein